MVVAALVVSILALFASGAAAFYTKQQAGYSKQQAEAAQTQTRLDEERRAEEVAARKAAPRWNLVHYSGDTYSLTNTTTERAVAVEVALPPHSHVRGPLSWDEIGPGASVTFLWARSDATPHSNLVVGWQPDPANPDGRETAQLLIPRKPK
ncbi:MAG TPA: hypothetical protein VNR17_10105 [Luteimicrobium sp.]|nr:hypothetical protein [Luteimicrobium sp.]